MAGFALTRKQRLIATIAISFSFFIVELVVGFITNSLALVADAFHYLSDLIGFVVALVALLIQEREKPAPKEFTFGYQRATLLGAFFNGVFLLALSVSILVQAIERFVNLDPVENPKLVLIVGGVGLGLNILVLSFLHDHDHDHGHSHGNGHGHNHDHGHEDGHSHNHPSEEEGRGPSNGAQSSLNHTQHNHSKAMTKKPDRDLGMLGVLIHVIGDAINNIGVMIAAVIIWKAEGHGRYYVDPAVSVFIGIMILVSALPLTKKSGAILLQVAPQGIGLDHVKEDMESIPGIISVHELHIWRLDQQKSVASAHIVLENATMESFAQRARDVMECLHAYGIHSVTLQPELHGGPVEASVDSAVATAFSTNAIEGIELTRRNAGGGAGGRCQISCASTSTSCDTLKCCP